VSNVTFFFNSKYRPVVYRRINTTYLVKIIRKDEVSMDRHVDDTTIYVR